MEIPICLWRYPLTYSPSVDLLSHPFILPFCPSTLPNQSSHLPILLPFFPSVHSLFHPLTQSVVCPPFHYPLRHPSFHISIHPTTYPFIHLSNHPSDICCYVSSISPLSQPSVHLSPHPSVHSSMELSFCPFNRLHIHPLIHSLTLLNHSSTLSVHFSSRLPTHTPPVTHPLSPECLRSQVCTRHRGPSME